MSLIAPVALNVPSPAIPPSICSSLASFVPAMTTLTGLLSDAVVVRRGLCVVAARQGDHRRDHHDNDEETPGQHRGQPHRAEARKIPHRASTQPDSYALVNIVTSSAPANALLSPWYWLGVGPNQDDDLRRGSPGERLIEEHARVWGRPRDEVPLMTTRR